LKFGHKGPGYGRTTTTIRRPTEHNKSKSEEMLHRSRTQVNSSPAQKSERKDIGIDGGKDIERKNKGKSFTEQAVKRGQSVKRTGYYHPQAALT